MILPHNLNLKKTNSILAIESFGLILQNLKLICVIGIVQTYLGFWGERLNFGITVAEIQPKVWERRRKRWIEKMLNFGNGDTEFSVPNSATRVWVCGVPKVKKKKKKIWQTNCGNAIAEIGKKKFVTIVAMALPKMGGKNVVRKLGRVKKKKCYVHNIFTINYIWLVIISSNLNLTLILFF